MSNQISNQVYHRPKDIKAPSKLFFLTEGRALYELAVFFAYKQALLDLPDGDGHPVLVLPGLMTSNFSTKILRAFLSEKGYAPYGWALGRNYGRLSYLPLLETQLTEIYQTHGEKVTVIGWSMGGIFARGLANQHPSLVRQVITMGSPFSGIDFPTNADWVYHKVSGEEKGKVDPAIRALIETTPPVPFTAFYSKGDGIVPWQSCMDYSNRRDTENIEVQGSHCGLGHNPAVIVAICDRLAQAAGTWKRFEIPSKYATHFQRKGWNWDFS